MGGIARELRHCGRERRGRAENGARLGIFVNGEGLPMPMIHGILLAEGRNDLYRVSPPLRAVMPLGATVPRSRPGRGSLAAIWPAVRLDPRRLGET